MQIFVHLRNECPFSAFMNELERGTNKSCEPHHLYINYCACDLPKCGTTC